MFKQISPAVIKPAIVSLTSFTPTSLHATRSLLYDDYLKSPTSSSSSELHSQNERHLFPLLLVFHKHY